MQFISLNTLRKSILLYRMIRYRRGYGVHSPFVFNLITKVIEEHCPYYAYNEIEVLRKKMNFVKDPLSFTDKATNIRRSCTIGKFFEREAISTKQGKLLFRLANYFKSRNIIQVGPSVGLSVLYMTAYAKNLHCKLIEKDPEYAHVAKVALSKLTYNPVEIYTGEYETLFFQALKDMEVPDLIFFNITDESSNKEVLFNEAVKYASDQTLFVIKGIKENKDMCDFWSYICQHTDVRVTLDLYSLGIVLFNPRLHKRNYKVYF